MLQIRKASNYIQSNTVKEIKYSATEYLENLVFCRNFTLPKINNTVHTSVMKGTVVIAMY